jgi:hypothetical protein
MKRKVLFTLLWMIGFATVAFIVWCVVIVPRIHTGDAEYRMTTVHLDFIFGSIFLLAPLLALWLGLRGKLPGTKRKTTTHAA